MTQANEGYALQLSEPERERYRMMAGFAREEESELWQLAGVVPGASVADVGCGPGAVLTELAKVVGPTGTTVGIEPGEPARAAAREELDAAGLQHVEVRAGTGVATGLEPESWDCLMMRHVLTHTGAAAQEIVTHLADLARPGGHVYLVDVDLDATRSSPPESGLQEQFDRYAAFHRQLGNDVRMGPRLGTMLRAAGLEVVENQGSYRRIPAEVLTLGGPLISAQDAMVAAGVLAPDEVEQWAAARERFAAVPDAEMWFAGFIAIGRKPAA